MCLLEHPLRRWLSLLGGRYPPPMYWCQQNWDREEEEVGLEVVESHTSQSLEVKNSPGQTWGNKTIPIVLGIFSSLLLSLTGCQGAHAATDTFLPVTQFLGIWECPVTSAHICASLSRGAWPLCIMHSSHGEVALLPWLLCDLGVPFLPGAWFLQGRWLVGKCLYRPRCCQCVSVGEERRWE